MQTHTSGFGCVHNESVQSEAQSVKTQLDALNEELESERMRTFKIISSQTEDLESVNK